MLRVLTVLALFAIVMMVSCNQAPPEDEGPNTLGTIKVVDDSAAAPTDATAPTDEAAPAPPAEGGEVAPPAEGGDETAPPAEGGGDEGGDKGGGEGGDEAPPTG
jgi:hypothetical protein